jgi:integrase
VFARHKERCGVEELAKGASLKAIAKACTCAPSYYGVVHDRIERKPVKTTRFTKIAAARAAKTDLASNLASAKAVKAGLRLCEVRDEFVQACKDGVALNKRGKPYKRTAYEDIESALKHLPDDLLKRRCADVSRGDVQRLIDKLAVTQVRGDKPMSGSRIRSVVNAIRSLYAYAHARDLCDHDPAGRVRLPAMGAKPRDRVATPAEFARMLAMLEPEDALVFALAGYGSARNQEIRTLDWANVHFELRAFEAAADENARKGDASWRVIPGVSPLMTLLKRAWIAQGCPRSGKVCQPRERSKSGLVSIDNIAKKAAKMWKAADIEPIGLHEARHTCATWLDHAGVSPKVNSMFLGHKTPEHQPGAAAITLARYTHMLPDELERARDQLDAFLKARATEAKAA